MFLLGLVVLLTRLSSLDIACCDLVFQSQLKYFLFHKLGRGQQMTHGLLYTIRLSLGFPECILLVGLDYLYYIFVDILEPFGCVTL